MSPAPLQGPKFGIPVGTVLDPATRSALQSALDTLAQLNTGDLNRQAQEQEQFLRDSEVNTLGETIQAGISLGYDPATMQLAYAQPSTPILPVMVAPIIVATGARFTPKVSGIAPVLLSDPAAAITPNAYGYQVAGGKVTTNAADIASGEYVVIRCVFLGSQPDPKTGLVLAALLPPNISYIQP